MYAWYSTASPSTVRACDDLLTRILTLSHRVVSQNLIELSALLHHLPAQLVRFHGTHALQ